MGNWNNTINSSKYINNGIDDIMTTITNSDIIDGTISQSEMGYQKASFTLKKDVVIDYDDSILFTEDYTSFINSGTPNNQIIFNGIVQDHSLTDIKDISTVSRQDEITRIQPIGTYQGSTTSILSKWIDLFGDFVSASYGPNTLEGYFNATYNFYSDNDKTDMDISWIDAINETTATITSQLDDGDGNNGSLHNNIVTFPNTLDIAYVQHNFEPQTAGAIEFWFAMDDVSEGGGFQLRDDSGLACFFQLIDDGGMKMHYYNGDTPITKLHDTIYTDNTWYLARVTWYDDDTWDLYMYNNNLNSIGSMGSADYFDAGVVPDRFKIIGSGPTHTIYLDGYGETWDPSYTLTDTWYEISYDLPDSGYYDNGEETGGATLQSLLVQGAMKEQVIWALAPDGDIRWHSATEDSGVILDGTQKVWNVSAKAQIKRINRVVLKGAGGIEAIKNDVDRQTAAGQIIIFKDYRANITDQATLNTTCQAILDIQKDPPLIVNLSLQWEDKGWIQVGETIHIEENKIKYNNSSNYIPHGDYRIRSETYHIKDGAYNHIDLILEDGLQYIEQKDKDKISHNTQNANTAYGGTITGGTSGLSNIVEDNSPELGGDLDLNGFNIDFPTTPNIDDVIDDDSMATADATNLATAESIKVYVDNNDHSETHVLATTGPHTDSLPWSDLNKTSSDLNDLATKSHDNLDDVSIDDHHPQSHTLTSHSTKAHSELSDAPEDAHQPRQHAITATTDHTSTATSGQILKADANGLPIDASNTDTEVASAVSLKHAEAHVLATTGPHTDPLPLTDLAPGTQGDIIIRGAVDWESLGKGTAGFRLKSTAGSPEWAETVNNDVYDATGWDGVTDVAPSKDAVRDVVNAFTAAIFYKGTWDPASAYPATGVGFYYIVSADGYHAVDSNTPERWYEIGDWIIWNSTTTMWDYLRNSTGDNIISVAPGDSIQTAIDEVESVGGGVVRLLPGTHTLTATLTINNSTVDIIIEGFNDASIIDTGDRGGILLTYAGSCILKNFKVDASDFTTDKTTILLDETNDNKIICENIHVVGNSVYGYGIIVDSKSAEVISCITNNLNVGMGGDITYGFFERNISENNANDGIIILGDYNTITNNQCNNNGRHGIQVSDSDHGIIANNVCISNTTTGIYVTALADYNIITNNKLSGNGTNYYNDGGTGNILIQHDGTNLLLYSGSGDLVLDAATEVALGCNLDLRSNSIQNCAYLDIQTEIRHDGDTDNSINFAAATQTYQIGHRLLRCLQTLQLLLLSLLLSLLLVYINRQNRTRKQSQ